MQLRAPFRLSDVLLPAVNLFREPPLLIEAVDQLKGRLKDPLVETQHTQLPAQMLGQRLAARQRLVIPRQIIGGSNRLKAVRGIVQVDPVPIDLRAVDRLCVARLLSACAVAE